MHHYINIIKEKDFTESEIDVCIWHSAVGLLESETNYRIFSLRNWHKTTSWTISMNERSFIFIFAPKFLSMLLHPTNGRRRWWRHSFAVIYLSIRYLVRNSRKQNGGCITNFVEILWHYVQHFHKINYLVYFVENGLWQHEVLVLCIKLFSLKKTFCFFLNEYLLIEIFWCYLRYFGELFF